MTVGEQGKVIIFCSVFCKLFHPAQNDSVAMSQAIQPEKANFGSLGSSSWITQSYDLVLGSPARSRELDSINLMSFFQLETFYDSNVNNCYIKEEFVNYLFCSALLIKPEADISLSRKIS